MFRITMDDDGQSGWKKTLGAVWIAQAASFAGFSFAFPFLPFYLRELGVESDAAVSVWTGVLNSCAAVTMIVFAPLWGMLSDRFGRKIMVERSMFGAAIALAMMSVAGSPWHILMIRLFQGALSGTISASTTLVASVTPSRRAGFSLGLLQTASFVGMCFGPLTGGFAAELIGYRHCFHVAAGMLALGGVLVTLFAREENVRAGARSGNTAAGAPGLRALLLSGGFLSLLAATTMMFMARNAVGSIFPLYVETILPAADAARAPSVTGLMLGLTGAAAAGSAMFFGWMCDRFGSSRILGAAVFSGGCFLALHFLVRDFVSLAMLRIGTGAATGATGPAVNSLIHKMVPRASHGKAFGLAQSATSLGFGLGPSAGGLMGAAVGFRIPFLCLGAVKIGLGLLLLLRLKSIVREGSSPRDCIS